MISHYELSILSVFLDYKLSVADPTSRDTVQPSFDKFIAPPWLPFEESTIRIEGPVEFLIINRKLP
jgi:hypothetical protein